MQNITQARLPNLISAKGKACQIAASAWIYSGLYAYGATKTGVNRMLRSLAADLKQKKVCVASIHPDYVKADMDGPGARSPPRAPSASRPSPTA